MALRTAPCTRCQATIVFGERRCRTCGQVFDYGPHPPPEPSQAEIFDAILATDGPPSAAAAPAAGASSSTSTAEVAVRAGTYARPPPSRPEPPSPPPPREAFPALPDLDTGRFHVGEVVPDDVPGLMDSTLFRAFTPEHVDVSPLPGLEVTRFEDVPIPETPLAPDVETARVAVGAVPVQRIPGVFGSDLFKVDVDVPAGAAAAGPVLEVSPSAHRAHAERPESTGDAALERKACPSCGTWHARPRCPSCATAHPSILPG